MDRTIDGYRQRLMDETQSNNQMDPRQSLNLRPAEDDWMGGLGIRPQAQILASYSPFGPAPNSTPSQFQSSFTTAGTMSNNGYSQSQPSFTTAPGPARLSLAPQNTNNGFAESSRTLSNADNYFRQDHNRHQGIPVNQSIPRAMVPPQRDPIGNLINNMLMPSPSSGPLPRLHQYCEFGQLPEPSVFPQGNPPDRFSQFQPQRQPATPASNPNDLSRLEIMGHDIYGSDSMSQEAAEISSPMAGSASSPTTRVSLRRASQANMPLHYQATMPTEYPGELHGKQKYYMPEPGLPKFHLPPQSQPHEYQSLQYPSYTPKTLNLPHAPPMVQGIQLLTTVEFADRFRPVFPYKSFNAVQSKCFYHICKTKDNLVVSAPTGSGKTVLLEMAICKLVEDYKSGDFKIVYQAPTKSLCSERSRDWEKKFSHLNLPVAELTGDTSQAEMARVRNASIIITTPEKWDSITRKWTDHAKLVQMVKLFLIDEVHMLKDTRGATLEAVVSRMKTMGTKVRFIAISATVPNAFDIALWLGKDHENQDLPCHREEFGDNFRPVRLTKWVHGFNGSMNDFAFEKVLDGKLPTVIQKYSEKKPIMVFCFTRKSCETTARILAEYWTRQKATDRAWPAPTKPTIVGNKELQELATSGVAFHHAGLDPNDRNAIEAAFLKYDVSVICCTSTLAVGVNLPCHLVVLKGTVSYQDGGKLSEYSDLDVMQMLGRAGRPQFDNSAVAVIMTRSEKVDRYNKLISGQETLESTLHLNLIEHLNSEISLGTIKDLSQARKWIHGTFLAVRWRKNPSYYKTNGATEGIDVSGRLELICERSIKCLQEHGLVSDGESFNTTDYGRAMSLYMVQFETSKAILSLPRQAKMNQILQAMSQAVEFHDLRIKPAERPFLREFNNSPLLKFPLKENISLAWHKMFLMIQVQLGGVDLPSDGDFNMIRRQFVTETKIIFERVQRLIRFIIDCKASDLDAVSVSNGLDLARSLSAMFWENSNLQLRQIPHLGPVGHRKLVTEGINSIEKLCSYDTGDIERIMSRKPPYGHNLKTTLLDFPRLIFTSEITGQPNIKKGKKPTVKVLARLRFENKKVPVWNGRKPAVTFMAETSGTIAHMWRGNISQLEKTLDLNFVVELQGPADNIQCKVACDDIVGTIKTSSIIPHIPASAFPPPIQARTPAMSDAIANKDDFGDDGLADDEMAAALRDVEGAKNRGSGVKKPGPSFKSGNATAYHDPDEFADIDDFEHQNTAAKATSATEDKDVKEEDDSIVMETITSAKMPNGRWECHHTCRGGRKTNGKPCKHRCCTEGLDKPRTVKRKVPKAESDSGPQPAQKQSKASEGFPELRLRSSPLNPIELSDTSDTELVDLSHVLPAVAKEYRTARPQISHSTGETRQLPSLQNDQDLFSSPESFDSPGSEEFGSLDLTKSLHVSAALIDPDMFSASFQDGSKHGFQTGMVGNATTSLSTVPQPGSKLDSGNSDDPFDVAASQNLFDQDFNDQHFVDHFNVQDFNDQFFNNQNFFGEYYEETQGQGQFSAEQSTNAETSSPFATETSSKRPLSPDAMQSASKQLRLSSAGTAFGSSQFPEWTNEMDPDLMKLLGNSVEFEDEQL